MFPGIPTKRKLKRKTNTDDRKLKITINMKMLTIQKSEENNATGNVKET